MARRKHGEGSVYRRKDGRWVAQIPLENNRKKLIYCKSEKEANVALRKALHDLEKGMLATGPQQTLKSYLINWLEKVQKPDVRATTYNNNHSAIYKHIIPALGHHTLQRLHPRHIQDFYGSKLDEGLSAGMVKNIHSVLHKALNNAIRWDLIARNPCDLVTQPKAKRHEAHPLTQEQVRQLLDAARGYQMEALLTVAVTTGMRQGEILGLHWQDIDFQAGALEVRRSIARAGKEGLKVHEPKTAKARRKIALPAFVVEILKWHRERQQAMCNPDVSGEDIKVVFSTYSGGYTHPVDLYRRFKKVLKVAGLPNVRFHDLRHSAATLLLKMEIHPKIVQEILGHSSIGITMDIYSHVLPSMQQDAMRKMNDLLKRE